MLQSTNLPWSSKLYSYEQYSKLTLQELLSLPSCISNGPARFKNCKQLFEYQHLLLLKRHLVVKVLVHIKMLFISSTPELIGNLWQLKTGVFLHWCLICAAPLCYPTRQM
jgi:hypothetical protein